MRKVFFIIMSLLGILPLNLEAQSPDSYKKGEEGSVFISIPTGTYWSRGRNLSGYDYDNNVATGWFYPIEKTYKTIDIDEYTWTTENLRIRYHDLTWINHEVEDLDYYGNKYMGGQKLSWNEFDRIFGSWISEDYNAQAYRYTHEVFDKRDGTKLDGWGMPSSEDIWQLYGQAPKISDNHYENIKDFLFASACDNTYGWSQDMFNRRNISGLTLMPLGVRESSPAQVKPERDRKGFGEIMNWITDQEAKREILMNTNWDPIVLTGASKGVVTHPKTYYWGQARYRRPKTAEELGYRLCIDEKYDKIWMVDLNTNLDLPELPKGLERGIALRYANREERVILKAWSEIQEEAKQIRNNLTINLPGAPILSCDELYEPDPFEKGKEGSVFVSIPTGTFASQGRNLSGYDYDNNVATGWYYPIEKTYKTIDIDEYSWTTENLRIRYHDLTWINHEFEDLDYYGNKFMGGQKLSWDEFDRIFGSWISEDDNAQAYRYTKQVYDKRDGILLEGWGVPSSEDIWQLYGQAPKLSENYYENIKDFLFTSACDNTYGWSQDMFNRRNISGLTLMPLGVRESSPTQVKPERDRKGFGEIMSLMTDQRYRPEFLMNTNWDPENFASLYKGVARHPKTWYWGQARYRKAKTDAELGYKLYIDTANDKVLMLPYTEVSSLSELPKGLERGIALRYTNREHMKVLRKWSEIQAEAIQIRNNLTVTLPGAPTLSCDELEEENNPNDILTEEEKQENEDNDMDDPIGEILSDHSLVFSYNKAGERIERKAIILETRAAKTSENNEPIVPFVDKIDEQLVKIYPNPTDGQLAIEISDMEGLSTGSLTIYNMNGQIILKKNMISPKTDLDISGHSSGTYILQINMNGKVSTWKIIKK